MAEQDTAPNAETVVAPDLSNVGGVEAKGAETDSKAVELEARLQAAELKAQQAEMRARQLENDRAEETRKKNEEEGNWRAIAEADRKALEELRQQKELDDLMSQYDPEIQAVAKKLFGAGDLPSQMAALQEAIKRDEKKAEETKEEAPQPKVEPLNPNARGNEPTILTPGMSLDEEADALAKRLKGLGL